MSEIRLEKFYDVDVSDNVGGAVVAEARAVQLSSNPERPPLVKVVYRESRVAAWVSSERIGPDVTHLRLVDIAHGARQCVHCGCTDGLARAGDCSWVQLDPPICSECDELVDGEEVARG